MGVGTSARGSTVVANASGGTLAKKLKTGTVCAIFFTALGTDVFGGLGVLRGLKPGIPWKKGDLSRFKGSMPVGGLVLGFRSLGRRFAHSYRSVKCCWTSLGLSAIPTKSG